MAGIYLHIPFCKSRCVYCDFYSGAPPDRRGALLDALGAELERERAFLGEAPLESIYFGGGTPSLCTPGEIGGLLARIAALWDTSRVREITLEANPDDLNPAYLDALRRAGVNRLSIGIQSFDDKRLRWMNRRHDAAGAIGAVRDARRAGFDNLSIDLIYGLPGMTPGEWDDALERAIGLGVEHISAYHLSIEPGTELGRRAARGESPPADEEASRAQFLHLHRKLAGAGFDHYEVSNFARPGRRALHNSSYWTGAPYLGVGPAAHSYDGESVRRWNVADLALYLERLPRGVQHEQEQLSLTDRYNEYLMTGLRTNSGVDAGEIARRFGEPFAADFRERSEPFLRAGILERAEERYRLGPERFFISDSVIAELFRVEV